MLFKVLSNFKDERKVFIIIAVVIILIISLIKIINNNIKNQNYNSSSSSTNTTTAINANNTTYSGSYYSNNSTNTNQNNISSQEYSITTPADCINVFIYYCNNNQVDKAYSMLTDECKELIYTTKDSFYKDYYMKIFNGSEKEVSYVKNKYNSNVYKLTIKEDPLATGGVDESTNIIDTVTAVNVNGTYKVNVSNLIQKEDLNINKSNSYIDVTIVDKVVYTDYELYTIKIKNKTKADIILSEMINKTDISIQDGNEDSHYIDIDEYIKEQATIVSGNELTFNLKIKKVYNNVNAKKIVFSKIRVINKLYYDNNSVIKNEVTGDVSYEQKYTTYIPEFSFEVELESE